MLSYLKGYPPKSPSHQGIIKRGYLIKEAKCHYKSLLFNKTLVFVYFLIIISIGGIYGD